MTDTNNPQSAAQLIADLARNERAGAFDDMGSLARCARLDALAERIAQQPAAAQEACSKTEPTTAVAQEVVAWQWKLKSDEPDEWVFMTRMPPASITDDPVVEYRALYAAPVAAAPDRMAIRMLVAAGFVTKDKANEALQIAHGFADGPISPAAPGIDLEQFREAVAHWKRDLHDDYKGGHIHDGGEAMRKAERLRALIDASPKGGVTVVTDAMVNAALRVQYARAGSAWTGTEANPDFVDMRHILNAAMQATSAEVGP